MKAIKRSLSLLLSIILIISMFTIIPVTSASAGTVQVFARKWVQADNVTGDYFSFTDLYQNFIICRGKPSFDETNFNVDDTTNVYNRTGDISLGNYNEIRLNSWSDGSGHLNYYPATNGSASGDGKIYLSTNGDNINFNTDNVEWYAYTWETFTAEFYAANNPTDTAAGNTDYYTAGSRYFEAIEGTTDGHQNVNQIAQSATVIPATGHQFPLIEHPATAPTGTTAGNTAYWECESCHAYFSDANGEQEIEEDSWVIAAGVAWNTTKNTTYDSLAEAVTDADAGDNIKLIANDNTSLTGASSTSAKNIIISKNLTITGALDGEGKPLYTVYGTNNYGGANNGIVVSAGNVTIENIKLSQFGNTVASNTDSVVLSTSTSYTGTLTVRNVKIDQLNNMGIKVAKGSFLIDGCDIDCTKASNQQGTRGISVFTTGTGTVRNSIVSAASVNAIALDGSSSVAINNSTVTVTGTARNIYAQGTKVVTVDGCTLNGANYGVYTNGSSTASKMTVTNTTITLNGTNDVSRNGVYAGGKTIVTVGSGTEITVTASASKDAYGVYVVGSANVTVADATITANGTSSKSGHGICVASATAKLAEVTGSTIEASGYNPKGVWLYKSADTVTLTDNVFTITSDTELNRNAIHVAADGHGVTINGGTYNGLIQTYGATIAAIASGTFNHTIQSNGTSTVAINGGTFNGNIQSYGTSTIDINAGTFNANVFAVSNGSTVDISDGTFTNVKTYNDANCNISGGTFSGFIEVNDNSDVTITAGTFTNEEAIHVEDEETTVSVSGGTFAYEVPQEYCAEGFTAVSDGQGNYTVGTCAHENLTAHPATDASCTTPGNSAYWSCDCGKYFSDANATTEIEKDSWVIAIDSTHHSLTAHPATDASCTTPGNSAYWECDDCHKYFSDANGEHEIEEDSWVIAIDPTHHSLTAHPATAPTGTTAGNTAYWECESCHAYFSDANGEHEIEADSWVIAAGVAWNTAKNTTYNSLAEAVSAADAGDTIMLIADDNTSLTGATAEKVLTIDKAITITGAVDGEGKPLYTVYGTNNYSTKKNAISVIGSADVTIENIKLSEFGNEAATGSYGSVIRAEADYSGKLTVSNVAIDKINRAGILILGGEAEIDGCTIDCAKTYGSSAMTKGIEVHNSAEATIKNTTITNVTSTTTGYNASGIEAYNSATVTIESSSIESTGKANGVGPQDNSIVIIKDSEITAENYGVYLYDSSNVSIEGTAITVDGGTTYSGVGIVAAEDSNLSITDNSTITASGTSSKGVWAYTSGDVALEDTTVTAETAVLANAAASDVTIDGGTYTGGIQVSNNSTLTIEGGTFGGGNIQTYGDSATTIEGGTFNKKIITNANATVEISGGEFTANNAFKEYNTSSIEVTGGTFAYEVPQEYCAEGYTAVPANEQGKYVVDVCLHEHVTAHPATDASCTEDGNTAYWSCDDCGMCFNNEDCADVHKIAENSWVIPAIGHDWDPESITWAWDGVASAAATFTCSHDNTHFIELNATITSEVTTPATATTNGVRTYTAKVTLNEVEYEDDKEEVIPFTGVAKIGEVKYTSLADAIAAVPTDSTATTITLLEDITTTASTAIATGKNITLDLNGHSITADLPKSNVFALSGTASLTVQDSAEGGIIENTGSTNDNAKVITMAGTSSLTVKSGTIRGAKKTVYSSSANTAIMIEGGTVMTTASGGHGAIYSSGPVTVTGGTISAPNDNFAISAKKAVNVSGDAVISGKKYGLYLSGVSAYEVTISGGTITSTDSYPVCIDSLAAVTVTDGTLEAPDGMKGIGYSIGSYAKGYVTAQSTQAYIDNTDYCIVIDGNFYGLCGVNSDAAVAAGEVVLVSDVTTTADLTINKNVTLDLNGHTISRQGNAAKEVAAIIVSGAEVTIKDSSVPSTGKVTAADISGTADMGANAIRVKSASTLNIEGGTYEVTGDNDNATIYIQSATSTKPVTVNISGGTFTGPGNSTGGTNDFLLNMLDSIRDYAAFNITGGYYDGFNPQDNTAEGEGTNFVNPDFAAQADVNDEGDFVIVSAAAKIGTFGYETFALARAGRATDNDVITLLANVDEEITLNAREALKVEKGNYTVTVNALEDYLLSTNEEDGVTTYSSITCTVSLSLKDSIDINFYVKDLSAVFDPADYRVVYTFGDEETETACSGYNSNHFIVAKCSARQMGDKVHIVVYDPYGTKIKDRDFCIKDYCDAYKNGTSKLAKLCNATLIYGAVAQSVFNYNTDAPVATGYDLTDVTIPAEYAGDSEGDYSSCVQKLTTSLVLRDYTELNFYITPKTGQNVKVWAVSGENETEITQSTEGNITLTELADGRFRLTVAGISAKDLDKTYTFKIGDGTELNTRTIIYSPLSYAYTAQNSTTMGNISKALYQYHVAAKAVLSNNA